MKFLSLFSGIGGFDLGFERAGMECAGQVEIDTDCQRVLAKQFPNSARYDDVSKVHEFGAVDVICGGFPCQDLSVAGKRAGLAGERSGLWFEFLRIIERNKPRWVVIENVPGLLSSVEGRDFAVIVRGLVGVGYCVAWRVLDAQYDGVAQRRRRVFIVGSLGDGSCTEILFESESVSWNPPTRREAGSRVTPILEAGARTNGDGYRDGDGVGLEGDPMFTLQRGKQHAVGVPDVAWALQERDAKGSDSDTKEGHLIVTHALRSEGADASEDGTGRRTPIVVANCIDSYSGGGGVDDNDAQANHLIVFSSKDHGADAGEISPTLRAQNFKDSHMNGGGQVAIAFQARIARNGHGQPSDVAHSLNPASAEGDSAPLTAGNFGVRRLTPRECERLQSFPDDFTRWDSEGKQISDSARYRMLGNAVAVNCAEWIGRRIMEVAK